MAETAYAWMAQIILADGKQSPEELRFLDDIRKPLGLHGALAGKIRAVVAILNRKG